MCLGSCQFFCCLVHARLLFSSLGRPCQLTRYPLGSFALQSVCHSRRCHSGHIHISLENGKKENLFKNNSKTFKNFVSGMQSYSPELMLLFAPNANSFKRYQPEIFTPIINDWDWDSRKVAFRAIKGEKSRIENNLCERGCTSYVAKQFSRDGVCTTPSHCRQL